MREPALESLLAEVASGGVDPAEAVEKILTSSYLDLGFAKIDVHRAARTGVDEAIYAEGKQPDEVVRIADEMLASQGRVLVTRLGPVTAQLVVAEHPEALYHARCRVLTCGAAATPSYRLGVLAAGTSDLPVAEEAAVCASWMGAEVEMHRDVGVAGVGRLFSRLDRIRETDAIVVAAGMDGALPSVVAGLVAVPVIALPTSVGYGASFRGLAALLTMLNSCAPGVAVVNIDNGYGAAVLAHRVASPGNRSRNVASP